MKIWKRRGVLLVLAGMGGVLAGLYLLNASWLATSANGTPRVVAQRGVAQRYVSSEVAQDTCTAKLILPPSHFLIDNTIPSIEAAIAAGADVVEIDIRVTKDRQFVLFHDDGLACRTDGSGRVSEHPVAELKTLDVGYGYTADQGGSFPLRGKGVGLMPTLAEVLRKFPRQRFLVQIKDGDQGVADRLVGYLRAEEDMKAGGDLKAGGELTANPFDRLTFFGGTAPLRRLREIVPTVRTWSTGSAARCVFGYLETGWFGYVPRVCDGGMIFVPVDQTWLFWGWPNRFLARMREHRTEVMLIGRVDSLKTGQFSRVDTLEELARVPAGFEGLIWTDRVGVIGPAVRAMVK